MKYISNLKKKAAVIHKVTLGKWCTLKAERGKKNTEAVHQLSGVTYMQPCQCVRDGMKYEQRVGAEGLIKDTIKDILNKIILKNTVTNTKIC